MVLRALLARKGTGWGRQKMKVLPPSQVPAGSGRGGDGDSAGRGRTEGGGRPASWAALLQSQDRAGSQFLRHGMERVAVKITRSCSRSGNAELTTKVKEMSVLRWSR